jgi:hypothetical protein
MAKTIRVTAKLIQTVPPSGWNSFGLPLLPQVDSYVPIINTHSLLYHNDINYSGTRIQWLPPEVDTFILYWKCIGASIFGLRS